MPLGRRAEREARGARRSAGALEAEVMAVLWASDEPLTAGQVQHELGRELAYRTVLTVLGRLYAKGLLDREAAGRAHAYLPRRGPAEAAAQQMNDALHRVPGRTEVLQHFVETLDADDQAVLRALLESAD
ncbi:BlaI/MecI/CopY family transcriptional regulator [Streptomyces sp. NPDC057743]|uniref:BlaI/MecI/CopY family transcriptional regulator n=1 Tax=Streptomyces sp. NPDC057743 TaxID=3346236 RepID=UPI00367BE0E7